MKVRGRGGDCHLAIFAFAHRQKYCCYVFDPVYVKNSHFVSKLAKTPIKFSYSYNFWRKFAIWPVFSSKIPFFVTLTSWKHHCEGLLVHLWVSIERKDPYLTSSTKFISAAKILGGVVITSFGRRVTNNCSGKRGLKSINQYR